MERNVTRRGRANWVSAISTLLTPPIMRTGMLPYTSAQASTGHRPPSTRDIPPVTLTNIPHIEPASFNPYLSQIGNLYDAFQRAKAEAEAQQPRKDSLKKDERSESVERASTTSSPAGTPSGTPKPKRRTSGTKRGIPAVTPLSTIPNVYFEENFHL